MTGVLIKKRKYGHEPHIQGEHHGKMKAEIRWCRVYKPRDTKDCQPTTRSWGRGLEQIGPQKEPTLRTPWPWTLRRHSCERNHVCCLNPQSEVTAAPGHSQTFQGRSRGGQSGRASRFWRHTGEATSAVYYKRGQVPNNVSLSPHLYIRNNNSIHS